MSRVFANFKPLYGVIIIIATLALKPVASFAAVRQLDVPFAYKSRVVPPNQIKSFPGGISAIQQESYLLNLTKSKYKWVVSLNSNKDYAYRSLQSGNFELYSPMAIKFSDYVRQSASAKFDSIWSSEMGNYTGTQGKNKKSGEGIEIALFGPGNIPKPVRTIIGEGGPKITVSGSRRIAFSGRSEWQDGLVNTGTFKQSKFPSLHMEQTSRFKIKGDIGSKVSVEVDQDSNRDTDLANTLKLRYKGNEDDVLQSVEAGNTNLSLPNAQFIGFSQNVQGLFGIKATAKIANTELTFITSQEKGASEKSTFQAGAQPQQDTIFDYQYLHNTYFWLGRPGIDFQNGATITKVLLYKRGGTQPNLHDAFANICVDPHYGDSASQNGDKDTVYYVSPEELLNGEYARNQPVKILQENVDYYLGTGNLYVVLNQSISDQSGDFLAAYIEYTRGGNTFQEGKVISPDDSNFVLKIIKPTTSTPLCATWNQEWRNVYDLHSRDLTKDGFDLKIYKGHGNIDTDTLDQDHVCFVTLLGLDSLDNSTGAARPDCICDFKNTILDASRGHLIFPLSESEPFNSDVLQTKNPSVYNLTYESNDRQTSQTYYLYVKTSKRSSTYSLGHTNIIANSDVVKLGNGRTLTRNVDYNIDYDLGQITFISDDALNPTNNLSVDFEYAPFFVAEKKSFYGLSSKYNINDKSWISWAGIYRKETASDFRPRVGREPRRSMMWDSNFLLHFDPKILSNAVDALPLVETDAASSVEITGEVAQSFPNPNTRNNAYIDDFEGTREYTDLMTRRGIWTVASTPVNRFLQNKKKSWWYNPYSPYLLTDIWPDRSVQDKDNRTDVLVLDYLPDVDSILNPNDSWSGIMRPLYAGMNDQSLTQFIEIWYLPDETLNRDDHPVLHIDVGKISEDVNEDGSLNTEDLNGNGIYEQGEDVGLDGLPDTLEPGYNATTNPDPNGDDWHYETGNQQQQNDFSRINGTEGNRNDGDRQGRFDTEDINNNNSPDFINSYFEYTADLVTQNFVVDSTRTNWKLIRIPFQDTTAGVDTSVGGASATDFSQIKFVRLWLSGARKKYTIKFASIQLAGNKWRRAPIADTASNITFEVTVKNTQENLGYYPPPGVAGQINNQTGVVEKEQSLVLKYENIRPAQRVRAYWYLYQPEDYTLYKQMEMFVHGDSSANSGNLFFYFRMGTDTSENNFYEYHTVLQPGWDDNNKVKIDFAEMTALKSHLHANHSDSIAYADTSTEHYRIHGNPSLSSVRCYMIGIIDSSLSSSDTLNGEVWCDELRVNEIRRKPDLAGRVNASVQFADLGQLSVSYSRQGADFVKLLDKKPSGSLSTAQSISASLNANKFLPQSLGIALPISVSWQKSLQLPRLLPGSDIILPSDMRQNQRTESKSWSFSISEQIRRNSSNWLWNATLNRFNSRFSYLKSYSLSPSTPVNNSATYSAAGTYDLAPRNKPTIQPFAWTKKLFIPSGISQAKMGYMFSTWRYDATVNSTRSLSINQRNITTSSYTRDLAFNQSYGLDLFSNMKFEFANTTNRDISDPTRLVFDIDPRKIQVGRERNYNQRFSVAFTPKITSQFQPRFQFNSSYADNSDVSRGDLTRTTQMGGTLSGGVTLDMLSILGISKTAKPKRPEENKPKPDSLKIGSKDTEPEGEEPGKAPKQNKSSSKIPNPLKGFGYFTNVLRTIKPFNLSYNQDKKLNYAGLYDRPAWVYTLGLADKPNVGQSETIGVGTRNQKTYSWDYSVTSGLSLTRDLDVTTSYKYRVNVTRSSSEPTKSTSLDFPHLDFNLSSVEKFKLFKKFTKMANIQSNYTRKIDKSGHADTGERYSQTTQLSLTPVANLNMTLVKDIKFTARYDYNKKKVETLRTEGTTQKTSYNQDRTIKFSLGYSLSAPQGLHIPGFGKVKFDSQLGLSLDYTKRFTKNWSIQQSDNTKTIESNGVETSVQPKATYHFSAKITGGLNATWSDSNDKIQQRKRHVRQLEIWTELRF